MIACVLLASAWLGVVQEPTEYRLKITFGGTAAGENVARLSRSGDVESQTTLKFGPIDLSSTLSMARNADGTVKSVDLKQTSSRPGLTELNYKDGKVHAVLSGKPVDMSFPWASGATFGNFHPQVTWGLIREIKPGSTGPLKRNVLCPDAGTAFEITITPTGQRTTKKGTAKLYRFDLPNVSGDLAVDEAGGIVGEDVPAQQLRFLADGWDEVFEDPLAKFPELSQPTYKVTTDHAVKMTTPDGVELVQDVVRPDAPGKFPTILVRTPYGRLGETLRADMYAKRGYVYVVQDCRGRSDSGGEWDPFVNEERDGKSTLDWIVAQPWSDGKVGMIGASYAGSVQWAAAVTGHPALKCIVPQVSPPDAMRNIPYDFGVFALGANVWWSRIVADKTADMLKASEPVPNPKAFKVLPLSKVDDVVLGRNIPFFDKWLDRERIQDWKGFDYTWRLGNVKIPALHISGWWDGDGIGTKLNWKAVRKGGNTKQWLIYGPWTHAFNTSRKFGDIDYGDKAILELDSLYLRWFDTWLKGKKVGMSQVPHVRAFVTGANQWVDLADWPDPRSERLTLYLASGGRLLEAPLKDDSALTYTYDPAKTPVPDDAERPGTGSATTRLLRDTEGAETYVYRSEPVTRDMVVAGPIRVTLSFKTSARDTDFFVFPVDIAPNGDRRVFGLPGKIRASYLAGFGSRKALTPWRVYHATILPWDCAHELKAGHRLGLTLSSSYFPDYARNLGTAEPIKNATRMVVQHNTILHNAVHPSSISFYTFDVAKFAEK